MEIIKSAIENSGLSIQKSEILSSKFSSIINVIEDWKIKSSELIINDESQTAEIMTAKEGYKYIKNIRIDIEKTRKALKDDSLKEGRAIDSVAKLLTDEISPLEVELEQKAKFIEIQEEQRRNARTKERLERASYFGFALPDIGMIVEMSDEMYNSYLEGLKSESEKRELAFQASEKIRIEAEQKAESERLEKERIEAERIELQRIENERLKIEAEKREAEIAEERKLAEIERQKQENETRKIQSEKDQLIRIEEERKTREQVEELNRLEVERKQQNAPDKEKLIQYLSHLECQLVTIQIFQHKESMNLIESVIESIDCIIRKARVEIEKL